MAFMPEGKAIMGFVVMGFLLIGAADVAAQSTDCTTEIGTLLPCLSFVGGSDKVPSPACCTAFAKVVSTNATCLCLVLSGNSQFQINQTKALSLPGACKVTTPPVSNCNKASAPSVVASSPVSNPGNIPPPATGANSNTGAAFVPSMVGIASMAALILMKTLS